MRDHYFKCRLEAARLSLCIAALLGSFQLSFAQVTVNGPVCVVPGVAYIYTINGVPDSVFTMQVCITSGVLADSSTTCYNGERVSFIKVQWNDTDTAGSISLNSPVGNAALHVSITMSLKPGAIDSSVKTQTISYDSIPATIICSAAAGGTCIPSYVYQWQYSPDMMHWTDMAGAGNRDLTVSSPLTTALFYRRKVTETVSGSIGYSDAAAVYVIPSTN